MNRICWKEQTYHQRLREYKITHDKGRGENIGCESFKLRLITGICISRLLALDPAPSPGPNLYLTAPVLICIYPPPSSICFYQPWPSAHNATFLFLLSNFFVTTISCSLLFFVSQIIVRYQFMIISSAAV